MEHLYPLVVTNEIGLELALGLMIERLLLKDSVLEDER